MSHHYPYEPPRRDYGRGLERRDEYDRRRDLPSRRGDPLGYQMSAGRRRNSQDVIAEERIQQVIHRTNGPVQTQPTQYDRTRRTQEAAVKGDPRFKMWNSWTGSYIVGDTEAKREAADDPLRLIQRYGKPKQDGYARQRNEEEQARHRNTRIRRVQFSENLEIERTPKASRLPILRGQKRGLPRGTSAESKENIVRDPRDPTPTSLQKNPRKTQADPAGDTDHLVAMAKISDPPVEATSSQLFSPAAELRPQAAEPRVRSRRIVETTENVELNKRRVMEPNAIVPEKIDHWNVADVFSRRDELSTPRNRTDELRSRQPRAFSPGSDYWETPNYFPGPKTKEFNVAQYLQTSWRAESINPPSPSSCNTESPTSYLINKYSNVSGTTGSEKRPIRSNRSASGDSLSDHSTPPKGGSPPLRGVNKVLTTGLRGSNKAPQGRGKGQSNRVYFYSQLDEKDEENNPQGTELILLPRIPHQIMLRSNDYATVQSPVNEKTSKTSKFLARSGKKNTSPVGSDLPILAVSYDENEIKKRSTSITDESDSGIIGQGSGWDRFEIDSELSVEDGDPLIPVDETAKSRRRLRIIIVLVLFFLLLVGTGLGLWFFYFSNKGSAATGVQNSSCASGSINSYLFSPRYIQIRSQLISITDGVDLRLDTPGSPQRMALCWIADFDKRQLSTTNATALLQRYTLGVLYFSLVNDKIPGNSSLTNSDFLSPADECEWSEVICKDSELVTSLLLADKSLSGSLPQEIGNLNKMSKSNKIAVGRKMIDAFTLTVSISAFLALDMNKITGSIPSSVDKLTLLREFR